MMKKTIVFIALILCATLLLGCRCPGYHTYFTNADAYPEIWELSGVRHGHEEGSFFFPEDIGGLDVEQFFCRYDELLVPFTEGIQVLLEVRYADSDAFQAERDRIVGMSYQCNEYFPEEKREVFTDRWGEDERYEYALIDPEQQEIYYIYLELVPRDEVEFDQGLLPAGYTNWWRDA